MQSDGAQLVLLYNVKVRYRNVQRNCRNGGKLCKGGTCK